MTNDAEVAEAARRLRNYGERERYDSVCRGWNSRLDTLQAARSRSQSSDTWRSGRERRRELAARYDRALARQRS